MSNISSSPLTSLLSENEELKRRLKEKQELVNRLEAELTESVADYVKAKDSEDRVSSVERENQRLKSELNRLKEVIDSDRGGNRVDELEAQLREAEKIRENLKTKNARLSAKLAQIGEGFESTIESLRQEFRQTTLNLEEKVQELEAVESALRADNKALIELCSELGEKQRQRSEVTGGLDARQGESVRESLFRLAMRLGRAVARGRVALGEPDQAEPSSANSLSVLCANVEALGDAVARRLESLSEKAEESDRERELLHELLERERKNLLTAEENLTELDAQLAALNEALASSEAEVQRLKHAQNNAERAAIDAKLRESCVQRGVLESQLDKLKRLTLDGRSLEYFSSWAGVVGEAAAVEARLDDLQIWEASPDSQARSPPSQETSTQLRDKLRKLKERRKELDEQLCRAIQTRREKLETAEHLEREVTQLRSMKYSSVRNSITGDLRRSYAFSRDNSPKSKKFDSPRRLPSSTSTVVSPFASAKGEFAMIKQKLERIKQKYS